MMNRTPRKASGAWFLAFLLGGLFLISVGVVMSFQNKQIGTLFSDIGFIITFLQLFFPFPPFPLSVNHAPRQNPSSTNTLSPFSREACYALIARGVCFLLLGIIVSIFFFAFTSAGSAYALQFLASVGGGIVFLSGMATLVMAWQEQNVLRRRRWFRLEGIFGSLAGWSFMSASATGAINSPNLLGDILFVFSFLFFVPWIVTMGIGEIRASNGWALTAGGVLTVVEWACIFLLPFTGGNLTVAFLVVCCYPILFGVASYGGTVCLDKNGPILRVNPAVWKSQNECAERYTAKGVL